MSRRAMLLGGVCLLVLFVIRASRAELREAADGVFVEDFEAGRLDGWSVDERTSRPPLVQEVIPAGKGFALHLKGDFQNRVYCQDRTFRDFSLTVQAKKTGGSYAGMVVRDHWRVYFQMRSYLSLNSDAKQLESKGELFKSGDTFPGQRTLQVVCAGPLLHALVDGQRLLTYKIPDEKGRIGFYAHGGGEAIYDDLRIETRVPPEYYLLVEPAAEDDCLVYPPDVPLALKFRVNNYATRAQEVLVSASITTWDGRIAGEKQSCTVAVDPGGEQIAGFTFHRLPGGLYRLVLHASCGGKTVCHVDDLPLAVQQRGSGDFALPVIPVGAYYKYYNPKSPIYVNTYAHAAARSLRDAHFNAVVADPSFTPSVIDIFQSYGIATVARGHFLNHPGVLATLTHDEPKADEIEQLKTDYARLREITDKPITTCMVGDALGLGQIGGPLWIWRELKPELRCFRWYGVKKSFYGVLHEVKYKPYLPLNCVLRIAETSSDTPYWLVPPALGKTDHEAYYCKPTPAQTSAIMHLAMAYGADGLLFFAYQSHGGRPCFVDQQSLLPEDGCYAAAADVAEKIAKHAELLHSLGHAGLDIRCPSPVVDAVPRGREGDEHLYVYVVNKDTKNSVSTQLLLWAERWNLTEVRDLFSGQILPIQQDEEGYLSIPVTLHPGAGRLLATDATGKQ